MYFEILFNNFHLYPQRGEDDPQPILIHQVSLNAVCQICWLGSFTYKMYCRAAVMKGACLNPNLPR